MKLHPRWFSLLLVWAMIGLSASAPRPAHPQGTLSALETDVDQITRIARPSVVTVFAQSKVVRASRRGGPTERLYTRIGSGVAVEENLLITTASVVKEAERIWIRTTNGLQTDVQVVGEDPIFNLAVLSVSSIRLPALAFSTRRPPIEGEWVMAIGTSHHRAQITQSVGTIAYRHREPRLSLLQLTNTVYPGYSGGAVLDARGQLVGIVQGELWLGSDSERAAGRASFVLPIDAVRPVYETLRREGRLQHGYLGVSTRAASVESDATPGERVPIGALVESVQPGGPAARAGLVRGDLIVGFDRSRVEYPEQLARWVAATRPSSVVELVWVRDETQRSGKALLSASPDQMPQWAKLPSVAEGNAKSPKRISDLEREIRRLNRELERLKGGAAGSNP
jgi:S1-C subfamily serine protease